MAWPIGRLWRVCMVGVGVGCAYVWRMHGVGVWCAMAYAWRWVRCAGVGCTYGVRCVYALGARVYGVRRVYVVCTLCISFYDVVSLRRIRPIETKHLKQSINDTKRNTTNTKRMNAYSIVFKRKFT